MAGRKISWSVAYIEISTVDQLLMNFRQETEYVPWNTLQDLLPSYKYPCGLNASNLLPSLVEPIYDQIGWAEKLDFDSHFPDLFIEIITKIACRYDVGNCTAYALNEGFAWYQCMQTNGGNFMQCSTIISPVHRTAVYCALAKNDTIYFNYLQNRICGLPVPTVDEFDLAFGLQCAGWSRCPDGRGAKYSIENRREIRKKNELKNINRSKI